MARARCCIASTVMGCFLAAGASLSAADFIRGDANRDGVVSIADAGRLARYLSYQVPPECDNAADFNDNSYLDWVDLAQTLGFLFLGNNPPPAPYPAPGADPTANEFPLPCDASASVPLEDPLAALKVLDAVAPGGNSGQAVITIALSNSE